MRKILTAGKAPLIALIVAAGLASFAGTLRLGFIWDDPQMIVANVNIRSWSPANLRHHFTSDVFNQGLDYYRPLQSVSNAVDFTVWKLNPFGYHLTNLFFHLLNSCLVFLLALELGFSAVVAFIASALFASNPAVVEQLIVIAGRAEVMTLSFSLLSVLLFLKKGRLRYALSLVCFALAMLSKESGVITPALTALALFARRENRREYLKLIPFLAMVPPYLYLREYAVGFSVLKSDGIAWTAAATLLKLPKIIFLYLGNSLVPFNLHSHHMQPDFGAGASFYFLALYAAIAAALLRRHRLSLFLAGWYLAALAPKLPILISTRNDYMLDHWVYPCNFALFLGVALLYEKAACRGAAAKKTAAAAVCALLLFYVYEGNLNTALRGSSIKIYEHALKHTVSYQAMHNLAREYYLLGDYKKALGLLIPVVRREPTEIHLNSLALVLARLGRLKEAGEILDAELSSGNPLKETFYNRAAVYEHSGDPDKAALVLEDALKKYPDYTNAMDYLAEFKLIAGKKADAGDLYLKALSLDPYDPRALTSLGTLAAEKGNLREAEAKWKKALVTDPSNAAAIANLKRLGEKVGR
ncbi:MAG: tetratricopeptide repeat protein [Elusimicrobia bacterium]|nr:tetratricopeptide repeat protein [Elusimicrobiota bacterium]